jgi:hypothetical protein
MSICFHQIVFVKRVLSLVLYKIDFLVLKFRSLLLKPKLNLLNEMTFLKFSTFM